MEPSSVGPFASFEVVMQHWFLIRLSFCARALPCVAAVAAASCLATASAHAAEPVDLTSAALATASAEQHERSAAAAIDGDEKTSWAGDSAELGHWLVLELAQPRRLTGAKLVWEFPERTYHYKL